LKNPSRGRRFLKNFKSAEKIPALFNEERGKDKLLIFK